MKQLALGQSLTRSSVLVIAALTIVASSLVVTTALRGGVSAAGCQFTNGTTSNLAAGHNGVVPVQGTQFTKPSNTSCHDLNLSFVSATDSYEGWLLGSNGRWFSCTEGNNGFVFIRAGHQSTTNPPVLCSNVLPGTLMAVVQESSTRRSITVED